MSEESGEPRGEQDGGQNCGGGVKPEVTTETGNLVTSTGSSTNPDSSGSTSENKAGGTGGQKRGSDSSTDKSSVRHDSKPSEENGNSKKTEKQKPYQAPGNPGEAKAMCLKLVLQGTYKVIMPTAAVWIGGFGNWLGQAVQGTVLFDSGASESFISKEAVKRAALIERQYGNGVTVAGVAGEVHSNNVVCCKVTSQVTGESVRTMMSVLPTLGKTDGVDYDVHQLTGAGEGYVETSENFPNKPRPIDIIIGQDLLWDIYSEQAPVRIWEQQLMLHPSRFGSVLTGHYLGDDFTRLKSDEKLRAAMESSTPNWHLVHPKRNKKQHSYKALVMTAVTGHKLSCEELLSKWVTENQQVHLSATGQSSEQTECSSCSPESLQSTRVENDSYATLKKVVPAESEKVAAEPVQCEKRVSRPEKVPAEAVKNSCKTKQQSKSSELDEQLRDLAKKMDLFMTLEGLGISEESGDMKPLDKFALDAWKASLSFRNGVYSVGLTFNPNHPELIANKNSVMAQYLRLEEKFKREPEYAALYEEVLQEHARVGDTEKCTGPGKLGKTRHMPHSGVLRPEKLTSQLRVVFNGSAKDKNGISLNDCLLAGPAGDQDLFKILLAFREKRVAFQGDVKRMYLCIEVNEEDRDFLRFLWRNKETGEIEEWRFVKVPFGIKDAPFTAQETFKFQALKYKEIYPALVDIIVFHRWMDDIVSSMDTEEEVIEAIKRITEMMAEGGFALKKWISSSAKVMESIPLADRIDKDKPIDFMGGVDEYKALGVQWVVPTDTLRVYKPAAKFEVKSVDEVTKRDVASEISSTFDPLGLTGPVDVNGKRLMQRIWHHEKGVMEKAKSDKSVSSRELDRMRKKSWNKVVSKDIAEDFISWQKQLPELSGFSLDRCLVDKDKVVKEKQLHFFSDASLWAFASMVLLRTEYTDGSVTAKLVCSRIRVAGKQSTMPRLELMGAWLSVKLSESVREALDKENNVRCVFWIDSSVVYQWIQGDYLDWKIFVSNRVKEIHAKTKKNQWRHVPGIDNPADLGTRGITAKELNESKVWKHGPEWLVKPEAEWPIREFKYESLDEEKLEAKETPKLLNEKAMAAAAAAKPMTVKEKMSKWKYLKQMRENSNSLDKLLRVTVFWMRLASDRKVPEVTQELRDKALELHVKDVQAEFFESERQSLVDGERVAKNSILKEWEPYLDEKGLIRVTGRHNPSPGCVQPLVLEYSDKLTELIVKDVHEKNQHAGPGWCTSHFRNEYWCVRALRTVKGLLRQCVICKKRRAARGEQVMAPLPEWRLEKNPRPFSYTGIDFAGPIPVKQMVDGEVRSVKSWFAIFTCLQMRAIHLELVTSMDTEDFLMAFRRFVALRGVPHTVISDNGKTFEKAAKEIAILNKLAMSKDVSNYFKAKQIKWQFNAAGAPWWGSLYERLIRNVKDSLKNVMGKELLGEEQFRTLLVEASAIVNSRPLAEVSDDPSDPIPVTPAMLLHGYDVMTRPFPTHSEIKSPKDLGINWKRRLQFQGNLMSRFCKDYLQSLRQRQKWHNPKEDLKVGQIVLIDTPNKKRVLWPMARVTEAFPGRDGRVRSVMLKTEKGSFRRPVQKVVPLEIIGELE